MKFFSLFFYSVIILIITIFLNTNPAQALCSSDQLPLLLRIKSELVYNATWSTKLVHWNQSLDYCSWPGVKCLNRCVVDLDLSDERIYDGLMNSSAIFDLKHLQRLNLAYNWFGSKAMPARFGDLTSLVYLNLSTAGFAGQIPIEISRLTQLVTLDFSTSFFFGTYAQTNMLGLENPDLGGLVQNLTRLSELYLDGVDLSSSATTWGKLLSSSLPNLTVLSVRYCHLLGPAGSDSLGRLELLSTLYLDWNNLSALDPQVFARFSHLVTLSARGCELEGNFPAEVFQVQTLQTVDLSINPNLRGNLPQFFGNNSLLALTLRYTAFTGKIPESVGELKMLSNLILSDNLFTGSINATNWTELVQLENLDLRNNSLSGRIPTSLFGMKSLKKLLLSNNGFDSLENVDSSVFPCILDTLDLGSNNLQGPFPIFVFKLQDIESLTMSCNNFSQALNLSLIQNLRNLSNLDLSSNNLSIKARETDFSHFPQLSTLNLASSGLKTFPDFLQNQTGLGYLDLSNNHIHNKIPRWVSGMTALSQLNLSYNCLDDFEDRNLTANSNLRILDLRSNWLTGGLPSLPPFALYMDFSNNHFSSELSSDIGTSISSTYFFSLASNFFRGRIPTTMCNSSYLEVLDLSDNLFYGGFPPCLTNMSQELGVLNLGNNSISGSISDSFMGNCTLRTFDLSSNSIQGKLPKSLSKCSELEVLDLGSNRIDDTFPCWLKNISTLRVLVLRYNFLHGSICCPDTTRTWSMLQIVDLAWNDFSGSLDSKCLNTWKGMMTGNDNADMRMSHLNYKLPDFSWLYYQYTVIVTYKNQQMKLVKILTVFSSIDFSSNQLSGEIPDMIGKLTSLYVLNFSHNSFNGHIPASLGNLAHLESLDLSTNQFTGHIPYQLTNLNFLSVLNLSYNKLEGMIPKGKQFNTFSESSYLGNKALCGFPLSTDCSELWPVTPPVDRRKAQTRNDCQFIFSVTGVGYAVGLGMVLALLVFWEKGKIWHDELVDILLSHILHLFGLR